MGKRSFGRQMLETQLSIYYILKAIPGILLILFIFYGCNAIGLVADKTKGEDYINASEYSQYLLEMAENNQNDNIIEIKANTDVPTSDNVELAYFLKSGLTKDVYEDIAYNEVKYIHSIASNTKLKKDYVIAPKGKDIYISFYINEKNGARNIGYALISYFFGSYHGDEYINKEKTIISANIE